MPINVIINIYPLKLAKEKITGLSSLILIIRSVYFFDILKNKIANKIIPNPKPIRK